MMELEDDNESSSSAHSEQEPLDFESDVANLPESQGQFFIDPVPHPAPALLENSRDAKLAMEIVADIRERDEIVAAYGYTDETFKLKLQDTLFQQRLREAKVLWTADTNVKERIRTKAGMLVEDSLLDIYGIVSDQSVNPATRNQSFQNLARVAAVDQPDKTDTGSGFKVVINLPDQQPVQLEAQPYEHGED